MFYFVYHVTQKSTLSSELGISPCPEFDLWLRNKNGDCVMSVVSPPLRLPAAYRALIDAKSSSSGGLMGAYYSVKKSLAVFGAKQAMPSHPVPIGHKYEEGFALSEELGDKLASRISGRMLRIEDVMDAFPNAGLSQVAMAAQHCVLNYGMEMLPGITYKGYGGRVCSRCGSTSGFEVTQCPSCGSPCCISCSECGSMGIVRECEPLYALPEEGLISRAAETVHEPKLRYGLTDAQKKASDAIQSWYCDGTSEEALVWAVCGAGKTEVSFGAITAALNHGGRVLYAAPRRDVVAELGVRISDAFPLASSSSYYSGSGAKKSGNTDITIATTHQAIRFYRCFDLTVLDEVDAFPYQGSRVLFRAVRNARAKGGRTLFMSATPPKELMHSSARGEILTATIPARHHGHPLPVPDVVAIGSRSQRLSEGQAGALPAELKAAVMQSLNEGNGHFVFVPRKAAAQPVCRSIETFIADSGMSGRKVGWSHSSDPDREAKRRDFTEGRMDVLVCTSIMERGVTVPGVDVTVIGADCSYVFDYRALVQMAGRAGRLGARPTGNVRFFCSKPNADIKEAIGMIERMNDEAFRSGYLQEKPSRYD